MRPIDRLRSFEEAVRLRPDDVPTLMWLGEAYLAQDWPDAAERHFSKARSFQPAAAAPLAGLGRAALARRDYAGAVKFLEAALASIRVRRPSTTRWVSRIRVGHPREG